MTFSLRFFSCCTRFIEHASGQCASVCLSRVFLTTMQSLGSYNSKLVGSRVVSVLDSGAEGPGFKSQPRRCQVTVLGNSGVDPGRGARGAIAPPNKNIPGREYLFALSKF